jgi:hypothetical protein
VWRAVALRCNTVQRMRGSVFGVLLALAGLAACGNGASPSPFATGGSSSGGAGTAGIGGIAGMTTGGSGGNPNIGGPCLDDGQCNDGVACTDDVCDRSLGRCRFSAVNERCADEVYCNGIEICQPGIGCRAGMPVQCSDQISCTIDRCIEESRSCEHLARDADGDGDPVWNCGGKDCDDTEPRVNGAQSEVCGNGRDDNCDGRVDEEGCAAPEHDTCADALVIDADGTYSLSLLAAAEDAALSCVEPGATRRDVVVALVVPEGPSLNLDVTATSADSGLALAVATSCSKKAVELGCDVAVSLPSPSSGSVSRLLLRELEPGAYPLYVSGLDDEDVSLRVAYRAAEPAATNETCGTALELPSEGSVQASLVGVERDLSSACQLAQGDLVYRFELSEPHDVVVRAVPLDGNGTPSLSLRDQRCAAASSELDCRVGAPSRLFARALAAGTYFIGLGAAGPTEVELSLELREPTVPAPDQGCAEPPPLPIGVSQVLELGDHENSINSQCLPGAVDATRTLSLAERSDVLLVERLSAGDTGAVSLLGRDCSQKTGLVCEASNVSPVRARAFGVAAGDYLAVAESGVGTPVELTAFTRAATPATLVAFADGCDDAVTIPETGGRFSGNTDNAHADFEAGCDYGGGAQGGAGDQMLKLSLPEPRRVVLDMSGSDYATILVVRHAGECPGTEVLRACAPGRGVGRSFLDLVLPAGDYFVQIDGFAGASGHWVLDAFLAPP